MLYTKNLLARFVSLDVDVETIARELTVKTCEVEEIHTRTIPDEVAIGKVLTTEKHPDADKLTICQIDCGPKGTFQICTAADNIISDIYVAVALPGCYLPAIDLKIEPRTMRGVPSNGMTCSKNELGIPEDVEEHRIWILQNTKGQGDFQDITDTDLGTPFGQKYPRLNNRSIDVENKTITHRPDMFGHFGLAVECMGIFSDRIAFHTIGSHMDHLQTGHILEVLQHATPTQRKIVAQTDKLLTYTLLEVNDISIAPSDFYTRLMMYDLGMQPRNNRVDFSNLIMMLTGQPVHFFDAASVEGDIIIRQAHTGERFTDLFGKEHTLIEDDIVIADTKKILALAGIVGGLNSGITETTKNVLIEIANFDAVTVRRTWTRLGLRTDAELRYEKYINPLYTLHTQLFVLDELNYHKKNLWPLTIAGSTTRMNDGANITRTQKVQVNPEFLTDQIHGHNYTDKDRFLIEAKNLLTAIGCTVQDDRTVNIPWRRSPDDLTIPADIAEEVARLYGFDRIGQRPYTDQSTFVPLHPHIQEQRAIEEFLSRRAGFDQIETYPRLHQRRHQYYPSTETLYTMQNPLTPEQLYLRDTLLRNLLEAVEKNGPVYDTLKLFDIGKTREKRRNEPREHSTLCFAIRQKTTSSFDHNAFLTAKGLVEHILKPYTAVYNPRKNPVFHPKQFAVIEIEDEKPGFIGTVHPAVLQQLKLPETWTLVIAEIDLTVLRNCTPKSQDQSATYETLQHQIIRRDLSFVVDTQTTFGPIADALHTVDSVQDVEVFDVYQGGTLPAGKKSISLRFKIVGDGSLTTDQINQIMQTAIDRVQQTGATLRQ